MNNDLIKHIEYLKLNYARERENIKSKLATAQETANNLINELTQIDLKIQTLTKDEDKLNINNINNI